jgi:hypothetical protein
MLRRTLAACAVIAVAPLVHAQEIAGEWRGQYVCGQGVTALHLTIEKRGGGDAISATFSFGPLPQNPDVPRGAYAMQGTYDPRTHRLRLDAEQWIKAPPGYVMVGLDGYMSTSGQKISGRVPDLVNCSDFEVWRPVQLIG